MFGRLKGLKSERGSAWSTVISILVVVVILCAWGWHDFTYTVPPGYVGVLFDRTVHTNGGIIQTPYTSFNFINPVTQRMVAYPTSIRVIYLTKNSTEGSNNDESFLLPTSEGQTVSADINFSYKIIPEKAPVLYYNFRGQDIETIEQGFIRSNIKSILMNISGTYSILDIYGDKRTEVANKAESQCEAFFAPYGISMESLNFGEIRLPDTIQAAVSQKINMIQAAETAQANLTKVKVDAESTVAQATGQANATLVQAQAQAKANQLLAQSLLSAGGELVVQTKAIDKWNGSYPQIMGGSNMVPIIQIPGLGAASK